MILQARVKPERIWRAWEKAHAMHSQKPLTSGDKGITRGEGRKGFKYEILEVIPGKCFSILWKTLFVQLIFTHSVEPTATGCEIRYDFAIRGFFAAPVRWLLGKKIQANLAYAMKSLIQQIEASEKFPSAEKELRVFLMKH